MSAAGWFGPHGWNEGFEEAFEFKKLMNGEIGCATGEQGTVIRCVAQVQAGQQGVAAADQTA